VAEFEARNLGASTIEPVHFFLGLLKSVDVDLVKLIKQLDKDIATVAGIASDLADVRTAFQRSEVETTLIRRKLRRLIGKHDSDRAAHLRRSSRSRVLFGVAEAFVKNGIVKPIHLLSVVAEMNVPCVLQVFQDSRVSAETLLEVSTIIALTRLKGLSDSETGMPATAWIKANEEIRSHGWSVAWTRSIREGVLFWNVDITRNGIHRIVCSEDISAAIHELKKEISHHTVP
jgi:hypothetical protein